MASVPSSTVSGASMPLTRHSQDRLRTARPSGYVWEVSDMQKTQQPHEELVKVYAMIGAVVMAMAGDGLETTQLRIAGFIREELARTDVWSQEMKMLMKSAIHTLEIYPDQAIVERHRDDD
jgi:hypothetical protein